MKPGKYDLDLYRGDTYAWRFVLYEDDDPTQPPVDPVDLTGVTVKAEMRTAPGGTLLTTMDTTVEAPNAILMKLTTDLWAGITAPTAAWDLQLTYPDADASIVTVLAGRVTVTPDVTDTAATHV
jgi:hypothetical protein